MKRILALSVFLIIIGTAHPLRADDWFGRLMSDDIPTFETAQAEVARQDSSAQERHVAELVHFIRSATGATREERNHLRTACETLGVMGRKARAAVPWLVPCLKHSGEGFSERDVMDDLAKIGATPETAGVFIERLNSSDEVIALDAAEALGGLDSPSPEAVNALLRKLPAFTDSYQRMTVARALAALQPWSDQDVRSLGAYLNSPDSSLRYAAAWLWQQIFPQKALDRRQLYQMIPQTMATASCKVGARSLHLVIKSLSGDPTEDDDTVWIIDDASEPFFAGFKGYLAWFSFIPADRKMTPLCDVMAFNDDQGDVVVPMRINGRPFGDQMAALLYDPKHHRVAASEEGFGEVVDQSPIEPLPNGFSFAEQLSPSDSGACTPPDGDCGQFHGQKIHSNTDEWITIWWDIVHAPPESLGWQKRLNLKRTWEAAASIRRYFGGPSEFARAFGLDPVRNVVGTYYYRHLVLANGERWFCVAPAREQTQDDALCHRDPQ